MKFTPCSRARATMRDDVGSSVAPPNIIVPRHRGETFNPLTPSPRYSIARSFPFRSVQLTPDRLNRSHAEQPPSPVPRLPVHGLRWHWHVELSGWPHRVGATRGRAAARLARRSAVPVRI